MPDERSRRIALNEAAFRVANERVNDWPERAAAEGPSPYYCECANPDCRDKVLLSRPEYEHVRSSPRWFAVLPGHEVADVETVIERTDRWALIEKSPDVTPIVEGTDPRGDAA